MGRDESDEKLMARYQAGDVAAFEVLLGRHRGPVFSFLVRLSGDRARAEDLVQETWLKVVSAAPRWERRARFTTWLYTIARHLALDEARRAAHCRPAADPPGGAPAPEPAAPDPAPDRAAESALLRPKLEAALAALPEEQREVFLLREYAGLPFQEIARVTGAPENTVKSRMRYALEGLRRALQAMGVAPDPAAAPVPGGAP
ncbi:MAG TPA: RNA polymerase sigma factor [Anaeromyxobacteraceae bacterium]